MASFKKLSVSSARKFLLDPDGMTLREVWIGSEELRNSCEVQGDKIRSWNLNKYEEHFRPEKGKETVQLVSSFVMPQRNSCETQDVKISSWNLNKYEEPFSPDKCKETVQRVSSLVTATIVFLWIIFDICTHSSIIQLQPFHKLLSPLFIWSSLLEPFGFLVFVWAVATTIVVGAPFSRLQSAMLMFWATLMLVRSAKSITQVYLPILGIFFTGWYMLVEKQPPHEG